MPCTTILVGKDASYDGSTLMARNEDAHPDSFESKKFIVVKPEEQPIEYQSVISKVKIKLPENPMRYTAMPNADPKEGIWGEAGINEYNVAMSATETITSNPRVLGADPLVKEGIGEEDLLTIVLPYIHSAREGVERLGSLLEEYGTYEMNGIGFQDVNEIWWLETIGGHHWIAKRVPDDSYVIMPNQQGIDFFDFVDALGKQKNHMCSKDMIAFINDNHINMTFTNDLSKETNFNVRISLGSHSDQDHVYNTPRAWFMARYLNPKTYKWDGENADYHPESDDIPWGLIPEHKIAIEDIKYVLSAYYQGTSFNPYSSDSLYPGKYRPIGINRNNFLGITQLRPYQPKEIMAIEWLAEGSNAFNAIVPFYTNVNQTPEYFSKTTTDVTTENFYWVNRLIGAIADAHFGECISDIERYQLNVLSKGYNYILTFDKEWKDHKDIHLYLEECNQIISDYVQKESIQLLNKVLFIASKKMKNMFSRDDG